MAVHGYARLSKARQAGEGESLDVQQRTIAGYAMMHGLVVDRMFVERGVSESKPLADRPEGAALLAALQRGDTIITAKLDRMLNIKCSSSEIDFDEIEAYHAFLDAGTRDDTPFPSPWDEFDCDCVYVVDRSGQFLTREFGDKGAWEVQDFPKEGDCDFPKADQGTADAGLDTAVE